MLLKLAQCPSILPSHWIISRCQYCTRGHGEELQPIPVCLKLTYINNLTKQCKTNHKSYLLKDETSSWNCVRLAGKLQCTAKYYEVVLKVSFRIVMGLMAQLTSWIPSNRALSQTEHFLAVPRRRTNKLCLSTLQMRSLAPCPPSTIDLSCVSPSAGRASTPPMRWPSPTAGWTRLNTSPPRTSNLACPTPFHSSRLCPVAFCRHVPEKRAQRDLLATTES